MRATNSRIWESLASGPIVEGSGAFSSFIARDFQHEVAGAERAQRMPDLDVQILAVPEQGPGGRAESGQQS